MATDQIPIMRHFCNCRENHFSWLITHTHSEVNVFTAKLITSLQDMYHDCHYNTSQT